MADANAGTVTSGSIDARTFWRAVGQRATGATVVTAQSRDGPAGFLGLSATHVCADPPTMLVSIDKRTTALGAVLESRHFAINFLPRGAEAIAEAFGGRGGTSGAARFELGAWRTLSTGAPVLANALGALDCTLEETIERHGVTIAIGRVVDCAVDPGGEPLIYFAGKFMGSTP